MDKRQQAAQALPIPQATSTGSAEASRKPGTRRHNGAVLAKALLAAVAVFAGDMAGTFFGLFLDLSREGMTICGYVCAALVAIACLHALGARGLLRFDRHAVGLAFDRCGWLLGVNLVLGLLMLMPADGEQLYLVRSWPTAVLYVLAECACIGIVEESVFRGLVLGGLLSCTGSTKRGVIAGALLSALIFGGAHVVGSGDLTPIGLIQATLKVIQAGIIGAIFAALVMRTRSISGTAIVHGLFDFLVMAPSAMIGEDVDATNYVETGAAGVSTAISYVIMIIVYLPVVYLIYQELAAAKAPDFGWFCAADGTPLAGRHGRDAGPAPVAPVPPAPYGVASATSGSQAGAAADAGFRHSGDARPAPVATPLRPVMPQEPHPADAGSQELAPAVATATANAPATRAGRREGTDDAAAGQKGATMTGQPAAGHAMPDRARHRGVFITLEGIDGCGKSTQASLLAERLRQAGREVVCLHDPGSTGISEKIRQILLDPANADMSSETELLLYEAARAQLVQQAIAPALERGAVVICDRFHDSTWAYQHGGRGIDGELVRQANVLGSCGYEPDRTIVLDLDAKAALARATVGGADRLEAEGTLFEERVRNAYLRLALAEPERVRVVDAVGSVEDVECRIASALADVLGERGGRHA